MSPSRIPTFLPRIAMATARLTVVVDLPTPPLPELTMTKFFTCGAMFLPLLEVSLGIWGWAMLMETSEAPAASRALVDASLIWAATSGAEEEISMETVIFSPSTATSFTNPKETISLANPG